ncbi:hypothetical protein C1645_309391 [Glomus cerebriforme]|uniref:Uncharacterized protein n=1 Tax=Glomus cerebriforme TaxID=658196 RepID=A0A397SW98_9GLOM|nr:hypothetical protein C1645_309391 [Glomus cerebriforme]
MDTNDKIEEVTIQSREENSHERDDIEVSSTSKPQDDEIEMDTSIDTSMDDNKDTYSYVDSDENDPELKSQLKSLKKKYKGTGRSKAPTIQNPINLTKVNESVKLMREKYFKRDKQNLTSNFQSSNRFNVYSRENGSPKKKYLAAINIDDEIGVSKKKQSSTLLTSGRKNDFKDIDFSSSDEKSTNQSSRRKSTGSISEDEEIKNFRFSDDENNTEGNSFIKPDGNDELKSSFSKPSRNRFKYKNNSSDDDLGSFSKPSRNKYKYKSNRLEFLDDYNEESADEDYVPAISIDNNKDKKKEESNKRESIYLDTDDDELDEILSKDGKSKNGPEDNLSKSVSIEKTSENLMNIDGTSGKFDDSILESILDDNASLDDYVAVDKPDYSLKKKQRQERIIIHEESNDITEAQPSFQPGSSPMKNGRRYLAINWLGSIYAVDNTTFHSVTVEYNNKTHYRGYNFRDDVGYTMACLGAHGVLFAVESDTENPSLLYYKPNNSWGPKGEWMTSLPGEDVTAIALSDQAIVVATSKNYLRFFSLFGVQNYMFCFPSIVCMAAYNNLLLIAYHLSVAYKGSQNLGYVLFDMHDYGDIQKDVLPISKESTLKWLGFSEEGLPAMFDSKGVLYILQDHRIYKQARWVPVLDTVNIAKELKSDADSKSKSLKNNSDVIDLLDDIPDDKVEKDGEKDDEKVNEEKEKEKEKEWTYWPVAIMESKLMCFILKYGEDVPRYPRPAYDEVNWQIPLLHLDKESGRCEERLLRETIISGFQYQEIKAKNELKEETFIQFKKKERNKSKIVIELIQSAVHEEKYERALDLVKLLNSVKFLDSALKIAEFYHVTSLAEKINKLKSEKIQEKERSISRRRGRQISNTNRTTSYSRPLTSTE